MRECEGAVFDVSEDVDATASVFGAPVSGGNVEDGVEVGQVDLDDDKFAEHVAMALSDNSDVDDFLSLVGCRKEVAGRLEDVDEKVLPFCLPAVPFPFQNCAVVPAWNACSDFVGTGVSL